MQRKRSSLLRISFVFPICVPAAILALSGAVIAQVSVRDSSISTLMVPASYAWQFPGRDMAVRFGNSSELGTGLLYKHRSGLITGITASFIFGDNVKEDYILDTISTKQDSNGDRFLIDGNGTLAEVFLYERGYTVMLKAGWQWPVGGPNPNSGIVLTGSAGFMQHKIRIENRDNTAHQIEGNLKKGYDRLSNGLAWGQFLGYHYLGNNHLVNFFCGIEVTEAFTMSRRTVNYDTGTYDATKRLDVLYGIKFGWILPLYSRAPEKKYFY